jgi:hypothetical protein
VNQFHYGRLERSSPPVVVRGEDPEDLRDEIEKAEADRRSWWETI